MEDEMREEGREESDDRTISHPHGYWFSGTGYSKFGRKPGAEASCSRGDRPPFPVCVSLFVRCPPPRTSLSVEFRDKFGSCHQT